MSMNKANNPLVKGTLLALLGFFFMAVFGIFTKKAYESGEAIWTSFIAYAVSTVGITLFIIPKGFTFLKSNNYPFLIGRAVFGTAASFLYMLSMSYIPIINSTLLFNTAPIFIPILSIVWLKKEIQNVVWLAVALGFIGIIVIIHPGESIFTKPGNMIALLSGMSLAIAYLLMKLLTDTDPGVRIIFYYLFIGTLLQLPLLLFTPHWPPLETAIYAAISGIFLLIAQLSLVRAYLYADASQVGVYQYSSVVFVGLLEWMIWGVTPTLIDLLGMVIVSIAGIIIIRSNHTLSSR